MQTSESSAVRVRQPFLRGRQSITAIWFPNDWLDSTIQARRLLACWRPGATTVRFPRGDLLSYATVVDVDCHALPGWPLRQEGRALSSAALTDLELASVPPGDVFIVLGAEVLALHMRDAVAFDPAAWLAVQQMTLHETYDCSTAPPAPVVLDLDARPLREVLGDAVPPASAEQAKFLKAVERAQSRRAARPAFGGRSLLSRLFGKVFGDASRSAGTPGARNTTDALPARRTKRTQVQRWRQWLGRLAMTSQVGRLFGRAQARYLRRMLGMFEDGDLGEALRHAIPLGGESLGQAFGTPRARRDLGLSTTSAPAVSLNLGADLQNHLRSLYRRAFDRLDRQGRIDEAVFVLAELLNAKKEALDYLEKHERFAAAAELALGWDMPSDVIVRLYCLAGNWRRALAVARRDSAFANTVLQLEKKWPDAARRLRTEWGVWLTQQGDWLGAVEAVWPDESLRSKAAEWLLVAESAGGRLAARALAQRAVLLPDTLVKYADHLRNLRNDPALWSDRLNLAEALIGMGPGNASRELAAMVAPAVFADHWQGHRRFDGQSLHQLVKLSGDLLLQADLPVRDWPVAQATPLLQRREVIELDGPSAGAHAILDALPLHDQHYLVALGEAGVRVIDGAGRTRAHFAIPAQFLVLSSTQQVALALARRESVWRVSRIDLAQRSIVDLGLSEFEHFVGQFDGLHWTVARGQRLQVLDTQHSLRDVVWQVTDLPGVVSALVSSATTEHIVLLAEGKPAEHWIYQLPQRRLVSRGHLPDANSQMRLLNARYGVINVWLEQPGSDQLSLDWNCIGKRFEYRLPRPHELQFALWTCEDWLVISAATGSGDYVVHWVVLTSGEVRARIRWPGSYPTIRPFGKRWMLFDGTGRLMTFDVDGGPDHGVSLR